jgi:hypothetical protein
VAGHWSVSHTARISPLLDLNSAALTSSAVIAAQLLVVKFGGDLHDGQPKEGNCAGLHGILVLTSWTFLYEGRPETLSGFLSAASSG